MNTTRTKTSVCQDWSDRNEADRRELERMKAELAQLQARLGQLHDEPSATPKEMAGVRSRIEVLKAQIEELSLGLATSEADFEFFCS